MATKYLKHAGLAALLLGGSVGLAQAAATPPPLSEIQSLIPKPGGSGPHKTSGVLPGAKNAAIVAGYNYGHCYATYWYFDGSFYNIVALNEEGTFVSYSSNSPVEDSAQQHLKNACEHANYYWYVTNTSTGAYDIIWIYYNH